MRTVTVAVAARVAALGGGRVGHIHSHVGWGCVLWRLGGGGCARVVLLGAWQGMGRPCRSSGSIASHVLCLCCHEHGPWSPTVACGTVNRDQVKSMFVS